MECWNCEGSGRVPRRGADDEYGMVECWNCEGSGEDALRDDCDICEGQGEIICPGHPSTTGPIGNVVYCDGSCVVT